MLMYQMSMFGDDILQMSKYKFTCVSDAGQIAVESMSLEYGRISTWHNRKLYFFL